MASDRDPKAANSAPLLPAPAWTIPDGLATQLQDGSEFEVIYVHLPFGPELEELAGVETHHRCMQVTAETLAKCLADLDCAYGIDRWPADDFVAWVAAPGRGSRQPHHPVNLEIALTTFLHDALRGLELPARIVERLGELTVACDPLIYFASSDPARIYARAVHAASRNACDPAARELQRSLEVIQRGLAQRAFIFHYQPIVDVTTGDLVAYEALCRGTLDALKFPDVIFGIAERTQKVWDLGRVLRDLVAEAFDTFEPPDTTLFVNVHPADIDDPEFLEQALHGPLSRFADRVVVELTERAAIRDYRRVKVIFSQLRRHGYRLAIDDLGSGYAGLTALAELEPDFIKFDMALVRDLHLHPVKQRLIGRMNDFADEIGAQTISEGVECEQERDALLRTGCSVMQGYFFARPSPQLPLVPQHRLVLSEPPTSAKPSR